MVFSLLANTNITPAGDTGGTSPAIDTTYVSLIVFSIASRATFAPSISDSKSNTWTRVVLNISSGVVGQLVIYYCINPTTDPAHTFTVDGGASGHSFASGTITAWARCQAFDTSENGNESTGTTVQPGSLAASSANSLYIVGLTTAASGPPVTPTIDSGFTITDSVLSTANFYGNSQAYFIQGAISALNPTWTVTSGTSFLLAGMAIFTPTDTTYSAQGYIF